jgi:acetyl esterase/lipase
VLYLHGGGFTTGSPATHRSLAAHLAREIRRPVYLLDYRLAPEHPCPAALDDTVAAFDALTRVANSVALAGDSAGGGLALAAAQVLAAREQSPLQSVEEIAKLAGVRAVSDGAAVGVLPGRRLRLTVGLDAPRAGQAAVYQSQLVLAPEGADRPFYRRRIAGRASERRTEGGGRDGGLDELPHSPDLLAARGR